MKCDHMSVSRAETYSQCQQKYKYRYELKIIPEFTPFYFTFGKIVHKIIETHTENKGSKHLNECIKLVTEGEVEIEPGKKAPRLTPQDLDRLHLHVNNFAKLTNKIGTDGDVEWPFEIDLDPPNNKMWVGFIDRLIRRPDDKFFIIDYKTTKPGKFRKDKTSIRNDIQIKGYCYIVRETFKVPAANIQAALYYLEDDTLVSSGTFTDESLNLVPKKLLEMYLNIEKQDPNTVVGTPGDHCWNCDYNKICPFYKGWRTGFRSRF